MATRGETFIPDGWDADEKTRKFLNSKYPQVDIEVSVENFREDSAAKGRVYTDWQAGFRTFVKMAVKKGWHNVIELKGGREFDPNWIEVLAEARAEAFREPHAVETPQAYRTALHLWRMSPRKNVIDFSQVVKRVAK